MMLIDTADTYFYESCSLARLNEDQFALSVIQTGVALFSNPQPRKDMLRLMAALAFKVDPPNYELAAETYRHLIDQDPRDFDSVSTSMLIPVC